jgi:hypothetical protein
MKKKPKPVKAWAHQCIKTGRLRWIGTPEMTKRHAAICLFAHEKVVRVTITVDK